MTSMTEEQLEEVWTGGGYSVVAWARGQEVLLYQEFGTYSGSWIAVAVDPADQKYHIYKDYYGSCGGCDSLEAEDLHEATRRRALEFAEKYPPFVMVPRTTMINLVKARTLKQVFPANVREYSSDIPYDDVVKDVAMIVKLREGLKITAKDITGTVNQEVKQRALKIYGVEKYIEDCGAKTIHKNKRGTLLEITPDGGAAMRFVKVKDSSTDRVYFLRVPPTIQTAHGAVAWTFGLEADQYNPVMET